MFTKRTFSIGSRLASGVALVAILAGCSHDTFAPAQTAASESDKQAVGVLDPFMTVAVTDGSGTRLLYAGASTAASSSLVRITEDLSRRALSQGANGVTQNREVATASGDLGVAGVARVMISQGEYAGVAVLFDAAGAQRYGLSGDELAAGAAAVQRTVQSLAYPIESTVAFSSQMSLAPAGGPRSLVIPTLSLYQKIQDPVDNPNHTVSALRWPTLDAVTTYLVQIGFHKVPWYASQSGYGYSYAAFVDHYGVPMKMGYASWKPNAYRAESGIRRIDGKWTFYGQNREPNPEVLAYSWPSWWWSDYVWWWHRTH